MKADHKAALEWATNGYHTHGETCPECNIAAAYLELLELAKAVIDHSDLREGFELDCIKALRAVIGEE